NSNAGESVRSVTDRPAPKGQPPRNLSGTQTALCWQLWSRRGDRGGVHRVRPGAPPDGERAPSMAVMTDLPTTTRTPDPAGGFRSRHIGPTPAERDAMLAAIGLPTLDALVAASLPETIRDTTPLDLPPAL